MTRDTMTRGELEERLEAAEARLTEELDRLKKELTVATLKASGSLANNLCPDHRDKQGGKPCLACEVERLRNRADAAEARVKELEQSMIGHFQREHLEGDGPEIDRWKARLAALRDSCEIAWGIIANGGGGDWTRETAEWQEAAARWRDNYFAADARREP